MKLLLDTHIFLWACAAPSSLPAEAVALIEDRGNDLLFSAASIWKWALRTPWASPAIASNPTVLPEGSARCQLSGAAHDRRHGITAAHPPLYNDPFDRMLIGQALVEGFVLVTSDLAIARYAAPIRHVR